LAPRLNLNPCSRSVAVILNRRTLLASIGLVLPVVGAQAATVMKKKHVTKAATRRAPETKSHTTHVSTVRSHRTSKPHVHVQS
jgi:hypothetical protein